ncbi:MAG: SAM-dependent methyltransferase, partial [Chloroflexi bacterium RBG_16_57_8]
APGWYSRRHWTIFRRELEELAQRWQGGRMLNAGCGHGADFLPFCTGFELHGLDFSAAMLRFARKYSAKFNFAVNLVQGDSVSLPFADETFDRAISVATYHHIRGKQQRLAAIRELHRVLKPGGEAFITVWNRWQPAFWLKPRDTYVRWRTKDKELCRYYHLFSRRELEKLVTRAGFRVLRSFAESSYRFPVRLFSRNICLLVMREKGGGRRE